MSKFFCLSCRNHFDSNPVEIPGHVCSPMFTMVEGNLTVELSLALNMKPTRWGRFCARLWSLDISWGLAFMGLVVMNCVLIRHIDLTFTEALLESFALGFAIPRLLK